MNEWAIPVIIHAQFGCSKPYDMLLAEIKTVFRKELQHLYPLEEIDAFFYKLIEHYLKLERFVLVIRPELTVTKKEEQLLFESLAQLRREKPIQYIIGETYFIDMHLKVNEHVLIPRPETEELVRWIGNCCRDRSGDKLHILDIGTGSGCIAIALAKEFVNASIHALDVSEKALKVALANAELNKTKIKFFQADILNLIYQPALDIKYDIIVSNPPYVRELEKDGISNNVKKYEPSEALFVTDENPLIFYEAISQFGKKHLKPKGHLFLEINQYLFQETQGLLENHNFIEIELRKDQFGNYRMLKATTT